jgi:hypothetical protein
MCGYVARTQSLRLNSRNPALIPAYKENGDPGAGRLLQMYARRDLVMGSQNRLSHGKPTALAGDYVRRLIKKARPYS